jgi:hypothetical protein
MDIETRIFLSKILGEIYRIQKRIDKFPCSASDSHIYALLHGFQTAIDDEIGTMNFINEDELTGMGKILDEYWSDPLKLKGFKGYYDIENKLKAIGINRSKAITILKYFKMQDRFHGLIEKFDSVHSPVECKRFEISEFET